MHRMQAYLADGVWNETCETVTLRFVCLPVQRFTMAMFPLLKKVFEKRHPGFEPGFPPGFYKLKLYGFGRCHEESDEVSNEEQTAMVNT